MRRVAVTGAGALTALGSTLPETWQGLLEGRCGIRPVTLFDTSACRVQTGGQFAREPGPALPSRTTRRMSRTDRAAAQAAQEALRDSGLDPRAWEPARVGLFLGASTSGLFEAENWWIEQRSGRRAARLSGALNYFLNATADRLAGLFGIEGPVVTIATACSSSVAAIGAGGDAIRSGRCDIALAGGADTFARLTFAGFTSLRAIDPERCRPFDARRKGLSLGEGAAILVLEDLRTARRRGVRVLAEILGYGLSCDAWHTTAPHPEGDGAARAMLDALRRSRVDASRVGCVFAHGTGTPANDPAETAAIHAVFESRAGDVAVSGIKSMIGHCLGAAGAVGAVAAVMSVADGVIPPTAGWEVRDPQCDLDYVPGSARVTALDVALVNGFGFGGTNASLVVARCEGGE